MWTAGRQRSPNPNSTHSAGEVSQRSLSECLSFGEPFDLEISKTSRDFAHWLNEGIIAGLNCVVQGRIQFEEPDLGYVWLSSYRRNFKSQHNWRGNTRNQHSSRPIGGLHVCDANRGRSKYIASEVIDQDLRPRIRRERNHPVRSVIQRRKPQLQFRPLCLSSLNFESNLLVICLENRLNLIHRSARYGYSCFFRRRRRRRWRCGRVERRRQRCRCDKTDRQIARRCRSARENRIDKPGNEEQQNEYFEESRDYSIHLVCPLNCSTPLFPHSGNRC